MLSHTFYHYRLMVGYIIAYFSFFPWFHRHCRVRERDPDALQPEVRLYWLLYSERPSPPLFLFSLHVDEFVQWRPFWWWACSALDGPV